MCFPPSCLVPHLLCSQQHRAGGQALPQVRPHALAQLTAGALKVQHVIHNLQWSHACH